jgi:putative oxidoreductase
MANRFLKMLANDSAFPKDLGILVLRCGLGLTMLLAHGYPKLLSFGAEAHSFPDPLGVGGRASMLMVIGAEVFCSLLLIVGLFTRLAAVPLVFSMAVAILVIHGGDGFARQELGLLYLMGYASLIFLGAGRISLDRLVF